MCRAAHLNKRQDRVKSVFASSSQYRISIHSLQKYLQMQIMAFQERTKNLSGHGLLRRIKGRARKLLCNVHSLPQVNDLIITPNYLVDNQKQIVLRHIHEAHFASLQSMQGTAQKITLR